jgi:hypothetical protein
MKDKKERLTVTVDRSLVEAANAAVAAGRADSLSAWVNLALVEQAAKERRLAALADLVAEYESEHGVMTDAELAAQQRADRRSAVVVRGSKAGKPRRSKAA